MENLLGCLIKYFKGLVIFNFDMNLKVYYYAQFKVVQQEKKKLSQHVDTN